MTNLSSTQEIIDQLAIVTRRYYELVDHRAFEDLFLLFAPTICYVRGSIVLNGMAEFQDFYRTTRQIVQSQHYIDTLTIVIPNAVAVGHADVQLKDGTVDTVYFVDTFTFDNGRVAKRVTEFPGREV